MDTVYLRQQIDELLPDVPEKVRDQIERAAIAFAVECLTLTPTPPSSVVYTFETFAPEPEPVIISENKS